jgi:glycine cleavage system H protein
MLIRYTSDHEYVRIDGDTGTIGITDYAQQQLGDVTLVELPLVGKTLAKGAQAVVIESIKAASEIVAPVSGDVVAVNDALGRAPETVNTDPMGAGWLVKIKLSDPVELDTLLDEAAYSAIVATLGS